MASIYDEFEKEFKTKSIKANVITRDKRVYKVDKPGLTVIMVSDVLKIIKEFIKKGIIS